MIVIVGATGKVGYATSSALRKANVPVKAIVRDTSKAGQLKDIGCEIAEADLHDADALAKAIGNVDVDAVQVIVPPSPQAKDGAQDMRDIIESIGTALEQTKPKRVLAISDYGAHVTRDIGMPTMCRSFEQRLTQVPGSKLFLRSAEHMQNLGRAIGGAISSGTLPTFHDSVDTPHATISAPDLGKISAQLLMRPASASEIEIVHAEGPHRYSANDIATALSKLSNKPINVATVPRAQWAPIFEGGMSASLAELLIKANDASNEGGLVDVEPNSGEIRYGTTELIDALKALLP